MINNKIDINEDSELNKLNIQNNSVKKSEKGNNIYNLKNIFPKKLLFSILSFFTIALFSFIIISYYIRKNKESEKINLYDKKAIEIFINTGKLSFNNLDEILYGKKSNYSEFNKLFKELKQYSYSNVI